MAQTIGFVIETGKDGRATVVAEKGQGCGSCSTASQCHGGRTVQSLKMPAFNPNRQQPVGFRVCRLICGVRQWQ